MSNDAKVVENPVTGERATFRTRSAQTDGELLEFELALAPRPTAVPAHIHSRQEEHIEVTSGSVLLRLGRREERLSSGASMTQPAGVAHTLWNDGEEEARLVVQVRPALRTEVAIETIFGLARDGKTNKQGNPNPLQGSLLARKYDTFFGWPAVAVQKALLAPLVPRRAAAGLSRSVSAVQRTRGQLRTRLRSRRPRYAFFPSRGSRVRLSSLAPSARYGRPPEKSRGLSLAPGVTQIVSQPWVRAIVSSAAAASAAAVRTWFHSVHSER